MLSRTENLLLIEEGYEDSMLDFELSPFEALEGLHIRTNLHEDYLQLTLPEKMRLQYADLRVIHSVKDVYKHVRQIYDFSLSTEPLEQWWWHLDKVCSDRLEVSFLLGTEVKVVDSNNSKS
ncbi:hypothetical protein U8V72_17580 [Priestia filamentosa]|uniref:hypothetical protein n=1 Tax=Priestia filamentosa TaxID=1402861 RepID=UPI00068B9909